MGTLYRRFPTKDALIEELVHELLADVVRDARTALERRATEAASKPSCTRRPAQSSVQRGVSPASGERACPDLMREVRELIAALLVDAEEHGRVRAEWAKRHQGAAVVLAGSH